MIRATRLQIVGALLCLLMILSACAGQTGGTEGNAEPISTVLANPGQTSVPPTEESEREEDEARPVIPLTPQALSTLQPGTVSGQVPDDLLAAIRSDLAARLEASGADLDVIKAETATWPDSSLGCSQEGMNYLQVIVDGYWVVLSYGEKTYDYRADDRGYFLLCERQDALFQGTVEPGLETLVEMAREDLSLRLSVPTNQIAVVEARTVVWPDSSLGCPQPDMGYLQVLQEGALIRLLVGPIQYEYHSGGSRDPFLCELLSAGSKAIEPGGQDPLPLNPDNN